jgi:hypothetical protein
MRDDEDEVLADELGKLGEKGAEIGGELAGDITGRSVPAGPAKVGGYIGASQAAERLPKNAYETSLELEVPAAAAVKRAYETIMSAGRILPDASSESSPEEPTVVRGVVKAGYLNMNPAVVTITITSVSPTSARINIRGAAKEGLIKQHAGEQAAARVAALLARE